MQHQTLLDLMLFHLCKCSRQIQGEDSRVSRRDETQYKHETEQTNENKTYIFAGSVP